jgi:bacterioferritin-associated ferredoxin
MAIDGEKAAPLAALTWFPEAFGNLGKKQYEAALAMQRELLDTLEQMNHAWFARAQSEIDLAAEFIGKVAETRSIPGVATACQECISKQLEMLSEDSREDAGRWGKAVAGGHASSGQRCWRRQLAPADKARWPMHSFAASGR